MQEWIRNNMLNLEEFRIEHFQDVQTAALVSGSPFTDALFELFCENLIEIGEIESADRAFYQGQRGLRIDGYGGDPINSGVLSLILLHSDQDGTDSTLTATQLDAEFKRAFNFLEKSLDRKFRDGLEPADPAFGLADLISARWNQIDKVKIILITDKKLSNRVDGQESKSLDGKPIIHSVWDITRLYDLVVIGKGREEISIDLVEEFGSSLPALKASLPDSSYDAYLLAINGEQLARIYDRWDARLLESNVRVFLQAKGGVNRGLRRTLEETPDMFLAYNNGVTATANAVEMREIGGRLEIAKIHNLQIVNGGQTTASIHAAFKKKLDLSSVFVQVKLSVVDEDLAKEIVPKISEYANSQNKVSSADFFANHPFHVRIEENSRRDRTPAREGQFKSTKWFYERARGQYQDQRSRVGSKKFDADYPKSQLFTKTDLAKYEMIFLQFPHVASLGSQKNFSQFAEIINEYWEKDSEKYNERYFREVIAKAIIFRATERIVQTSAWYGGGYRANVVAYTLAKLVHELLKKNLMIDFNLVWREQMIPEPLTEAISVTAELVHELLIDPPAGQTNIGEWAKKQACWVGVQKLQVSYSRDFIEICESSIEAKSDDFAAKKVQRVNDGVDAQMKVVNFGPENWEKVITWASSERLLSPKEASILSICSQIPLKIPSDKQSVFALGVLEKLRKLGLPSDLDIP